MSDDLPERVLSEYQELARIFAKQNEDRPADDPRGMVWVQAHAMLTNLNQRLEQKLLALRVEALGVGAKLYTGVQYCAVPGGSLYHRPSMVIEKVERYAWHDIGRDEYEYQRSLDEMD